MIARAWAEEHGIDVTRVMENLTDTPGLSSPNGGPTIVDKRSDDTPSTGSPQPETPNTF